jgi:NAD(P)-dependent dehydrogenase (short-subunit alcohol dehydrogenase family)
LVLPLDVAAAAAVDAAAERVEATLGPMDVRVSNAMVWVSKLFPRLVDRYLAKFGYAAQQTDEPKDPQASDNSW